jgi:hypothetical protein
MVRRALASIFRGDVHADHAAVGSDLVGGEDGVESGAAADVYHAFPRL